MHATHAATARRFRPVPPEYYGTQLRCGVCIPRAIGTPRSNWSATRRPSRMSWRCGGCDSGQRRRWNSGNEFAACGSRTSGRRDWQERHSKRESRFVIARGDLDRAAMRLGNLTGDVEPEAKSLHRGANLVAIERVEQMRHGFIRDLAARICHRQFERRRVGRRPYHDGARRVAMADGVSEQIREQLRSARRRKARACRSTDRIR